MKRQLKARCRYCGELTGEMVTVQWQVDSCCNKEICRQRFYSDVAAVEERH